MNLALILSSFYCILHLFYSVDSSNGADLILTEDWSGPNSGVWIAKNSPWARKFMRLAFDQKQLMNDYAANGRKHPFEYEQRAFHYLLDTEKWRSRGLPRYTGDVIEMRRHVVSLPQCAMNSFSMHPLELRGSREVSQYIPGDFIVHLAGKKGRMKTDLLDYYLALAEADAAALKPAVVLSQTVGMPLPQPQPQPTL